MTSEPPELPADRHLRRLSEAVDIYLQRDASQSAATADELIAEHPELGDLLEPMLRPPDETAATVESPRFFGDYELIREIGRGGMGVVYEAREISLERRVALKILPEGEHQSASRIERFRREAAAAGRLHHPGIAAVYRVGEVGATHFIAMEMIEGDDLATAIKQLATQPGNAEDWGQATPFHLVGDGGRFADIAELVARIGDALHFAHEHGVVHRDVKPHNVLLGGESGVKLVDFGLAKDLARDQVTRTGDTAGTPDYMSPEQVRGEAIDARTDVYSLGVVLYELLTLERPFHRGGIHEVMHAILTREPDPPRQSAPRIPRELETICLCALEKERNARYQSAADLAADLRRFRRHEPIRATPPSTITRTLKLVRRHRAAALATLFAILALVVAPAVFALHFKRSRDAIRIEKLETEQQRDLASSILAEARRSIDELHTWLADDRLAGSPRMADVRTELLERARDFYDSFSALSSGAPALQTQSGLARIRLGRILSSLSRPAEARSQLEDALEILAAVEPPPGQVAEVLMARAHGHGNLSSVLRHRGLISEARIHLDAALSLLDFTPKREVEQRRILHARAHAHRRLAQHIDEYESDEDAAIRQLSAAIEAWSSLADKAPDNASCHRLLASTLSWRGTILASRSDKEPALDDARRALQLIEGSSEDPPKDTRVRTTLARTFSRCGEIHSRLKSFDAAETLYRRAATITKTIAAEFPEFEQYRLDHAQSLFQLARTEFERGNAPDAVPHLEAAFEQLRSLGDTIRQSIPCISLTSSIIGPLTIMRQRIGSSSAADVLELHEATIADLEAASKRTPDSTTLRIILAHGLDNYGSALWKAGMNDDAHRTMRRAGSMFDQLTTLRPGDAQLAEAHWRGYAQLSRFELATGRTFEAAASIVRAAEIAPGEVKALYAAAKTTAIASTFALENGDVGTPGRKRRAEAYRLQSLQHLQRAKAIDPTVIDSAKQHEAFTALRSSPGFAELFSQQD